MIDCSDHEMNDSRASFDKTVLNGIHFVRNKVRETIKHNSPSSLGGFAVELLYSCIRLRCHLFFKNRINICTPAILWDTAN